MTPTGANQTFPIFGVFQGIIIKKNTRLHVGIFVSVRYEILYRKGGRGYKPMTIITDFFISVLYGSDFGGHLML